MGSLNWHTGLLSSDKRKTTYHTQIRHRTLTEEADKYLRVRQFEYHTIKENSISSVQVEAVSIQVYPAEHTQAHTAGCGARLRRAAKSGRSQKEGLVRSMVFLQLAEGWRGHCQLWRTDYRQH